MRTPGLPVSAGWSSTNAAGAALPRTGDRRRLRGILHLFLSSELSPMPIPKSLVALAAGVALSSAPAAAQGRWLASYPEVQDPVFAQMRIDLQQDRMLEGMTDPMNEVFRVPRDLTLEIAECGTPSATYDSPSATIRICYELIMELIEHEDALDPGGLDGFDDAFAFILLHQVGHAVVDVLQLDLGDSPEDAADQFVALMAGMAPGELDGLVDGVAALQDLELDWETPDTGATTIDSRRGAKLMCLLYGGNPGAHANLVEQGEFTSTRAANCISEYDNAQAWWTALLEAHLNQG